MRLAGHQLRTQYVTCCFSVLAVLSPVHPHTMFYLGSSHCSTLQVLMGPGNGVMRLCNHGSESPTHGNGVMRLCNHGSESPTHGMGL